MTDHDDYALHQLDPEFDEPDGSADETWLRESRPVDPQIEEAAQRQLPPEHIAFAGQTALHHYTPKL